MTAVLLSVHVIAAIVLIGPITAAASLFPRYGREALAAVEAGAGGAAAGSSPTAVARALHRISAGYALPALAVPVFGIATAAQLGVLGEVWLWVSMALTAVAAGLLVGLIVPTQRRVLALLAGGDTTARRALGDQLRRLSMTTGVFASSWVVVTVLMILRPGSTTGVA